MKRMLIVAVSLLACSPLTTLAQTPRAGVVTAIEGQATLTRAVLPHAVALRFRDDVLVHDRIDTRERSIVRILFGGKAVITVREQSSMTVSEEPSRSIVDMADGRMALNLAKSRMRPGDVFEIRTPNVVAAIRGSFVVVDTRVVDGVRETDIFAVHVSQPVTISQRSDPRVSTAITSGQGIRVIGLGSATVVMPVTPMTPAQTRAAVRVADVPRQDVEQPRAADALTQALVNTQIARAAEATALTGKPETAGARSGGAPRDDRPAQAAAAVMGPMRGTQLGDVFRSSSAIPGGAGANDAAVTAGSTSRAITTNRTPIADLAGNAAIAPGAATGGTGAVASSGGGGSSTAGAAGQGGAISNAARPGSQVSPNARGPQPAPGNGR